MKGTIKSKAEMERLFREGRRSSSSLMTVIASDSASGVGRCAYVAGKKLGPAPFRNRCKRVLRSVSHELGAPWEGRDVVIVARRRTARAPYGELEEQLRRNLRKLGVMR